MLTSSQTLKGIFCLFLLGLQMVSADLIPLSRPAGEFASAWKSVIKTLPNGNIVIVDPGYDAPGPVLDVGAVCLYEGRTGRLISTLTGSSEGDQVGSGGISILKNGNFVVLSTVWNESRGAVSWVSSTQGAEGTVSAANSLVGSHAYDYVGFSGCDILPNGDFLIRSTSWANGGIKNAGAITRGSGSAGLTGEITANNSLVGSNPDDRIGYELAMLPNDCFVVRSPNWNATRGAVTFFSATGNLTGALSPSNSLTGGQQGDNVGGTPISILTNGNYVVSSASWSNGNVLDVGAVTLCSGVTGLTGLVSPANSLIGGTANAQIGSWIRPLSNGNFVVQNLGSYNFGSPTMTSVTWRSGTVNTPAVVSAANSLINTGEQGGTFALENGNYIVFSQDWNERRGAITWGNGTTGVSGPISEANSIIGSQPNDKVGTGVIGNFGITRLTNGNLVVSSPFWNEFRGAVTWINAATGASGVLSAANSLVGSTPGDGVGQLDLKILSNGNYLVPCTEWSNGPTLGVGAVVWGSASTGVKGAISPANALVGTTQFEHITATPLTNGNYVAMGYWIGRRGAATWCDGSSGRTGFATEENSLTGSRDDDGLGGYAEPLPDGNYVVFNPRWNGDRGAMTWCNGQTGRVGTVSSANSLVGGEPGDKVGAYYEYNSKTIARLLDGRFLIRSLSWRGNRGAVTLIDGTAPVSGIVSEANSLVGTNAGDGVGWAVVSLTNGNYVVASPEWNGSRGALTFCHRQNPLAGSVGPLNSLVGSASGDKVGLSPCFEVGGGNFVVRSPYWNESRGAATWLSGTAGAIGPVSAANSLVGSTAGDNIGGNIAVLANGNFVLCSGYWNRGRGAATFANGSTGAKGIVSSANSLVGSSSTSYPYWYLYPLANGNYLVMTPYWKSAGLRQGAVTWGNGVTGVRGEISEATSRIGISEDDFLGESYWNAPDVTTYGDGSYLIKLPGFDNGPIVDAGAAIHGDGETAITGAISASNSLLGSGAMEKFGHFHDQTANRLIVASTSHLALIGYSDFKLTGNGTPITNSDPTAETTDGTDFGTVASPEGRVTRTFTILNNGGLPLYLTGNPQVSVNGPNSTDFVVTKQPESQISSGSLTSFEVTFTPSVSGGKTAVISIEHNDGDKNPFTFAIKGKAVKPIEIWGSNYFAGSLVNIAPQEDFDGDGVPNILEFAFGSRPDRKSSGVAPLTYTGPAAGGSIVQATGQPLIMSDPANPSNYYGLFVRRKDFIASGLHYTPQFSLGIDNWQTAVNPVVWADDETYQIVAVPFPPSSTTNGSCFFRIKLELAP